MARLFITPREQAFVADIANEIIKDVNGQVLHLYPISELKTKAHDVYNESDRKQFDQPIALDAMVDAQFHESTKIDQFGIDQVYKLEAYVSYRDVVNRGITVAVGDFVSFSDIFYEITNVTIVQNVFGQAEHRQGLKIVATKARQGQFEAVLKGPTDISYTDKDAVQKEFHQSRGEDPKVDRRELIDQGVIEPLSGPKEVSEKGAASDNSGYESSFYSEDD